MTAPGINPLQCWGLNIIIISIEYYTIEVNLDFDRFQYQNPQLDPLPMSLAPLGAPQLY